MKKMILMLMAMVVFGNVLGVSSTDFPGGEGSKWEEGYIESVSMTPICPGWQINIRFKFKENGQVYDKLVYSPKLLDDLFNVGCDNFAINRAYATLLAATTNGSLVELYFEPIKTGFDFVPVTQIKIKKQ